MKRHLTRSFVVVPALLSCLLLGLAHAEDDGAAPGETPAGVEAPAAQEVQPPPAQAAADPDSDEIPEVGEPSMELLEKMDGPPPPPQFIKELTDKARQLLKDASFQALESFKDSSLGAYFHRELIRREEVCGKKYTWQMDSVEDYANEETGRAAVWFPGRVKILADPQEAFLAKKLAIQNAKCEVLVNTYIYNDALTTKALVHELTKAIERGVKVTFTIDSSGSGAGNFEKSGPLHSDLKVLHFAKPGINHSGLKCNGQKATVDTVIFNPQIRLKNLLNAGVAELLGINSEGRTSLDVNRRSHDKILLVDQSYPEHSVAIVGGRNWTDSYYGIPEPDSHTYEDMEVLVRDDASKKSPITLKETVGAHAHRLFCHKGNRWLEATRLTKNRMAEFKAAYNELLNRPNVKALEGKMGANFLDRDLSPAQVRWGNEIQNIRRPQEDAGQDPNRLAARTNNPDSIVDISRELIATAKKSIRIVSPYLYLSTKERDVLKAWTIDKPGRKLLIVSNSMMTSDNVPAQTLVDRMVAPDFHTEGKLLDGRPWGSNPEFAAFYELGRSDSDRLEANANNPNKKPYGKLHAKYWTIDGEISYVGSHNFDPRSRYYNSEVGFFIRSKKIARDLERSFQAAQDRSYVWGGTDWKALYESEVFETKRRAQDYLESLFEQFPGLASLI